MNVTPRRQPLPISTGAFKPLREQGQLYIDKTRHMASLLQPEYRFAFLARPRRFGKSLLVSTLEALLQGRRDLFQGTWIHDSDWPWEPHAVIRLDMTNRRMGGASALEQSLRNRMPRLYRAHGEEMPQGNWSASELLEELIQRLAERMKVAVLIDEYDSPILGKLESAEDLSAIRDVLRQFYGVLKICDDYLSFAFLTGITRFVRTGIFSGHNNLEDVSHQSAFSDLVGFTEEELERHLTPYMADTARSWQTSLSAVRQALRSGYDGYLFAKGGTRVYNPYSIMHCLHYQKLAHYWPTTGLPTYLTRMIAQQRVEIRCLAGQKAPDLAYAYFHWDKPDLQTIMYQAGYLTLALAADGKEYVLTYPNREVERSFILTLLSEFTSKFETATRTARILHAALAANDYDRFFGTFNPMLQLIPYEIFVGDHRHYQLLLHSIFVMLGLRTASEHSNYLGRMDTAVELSDKVVIFEYKLDASPAAALAQLEEKGYHREFLARGTPVVGVGVQFDTAKRQAKTWHARQYETGADVSVP